MKTTWNKLLTVVELMILSTMVVLGQNEHPQHTSKEAKDKSGQMMKDAPYDLHFIDMMTMHHQQGIEMAQMAVKKAHHAELKGLAQKMIDGQRQDIKQMKGRRDNWYPGQPKAMMMDMHKGMHKDADHDMHKDMSDMSPAKMKMDMDKLKAASGNAFDLTFLELMTAHHQMAIKMLKEALEKAEHAELKMLAQKMLDGQQKESDQMSQWKTAWSRG